jgi:hypothetical protein
MADKHSDEQNRQQFERWLDGEKVSDEQQQSWHEDEQLADLHDASLWLKHQSECYQQRSVPDWNADKTFDYQGEKNSWFSWLHLSPGLSMAMSFAAIFMVLFKVELQFNEQGILLSFAGNQQQAFETRLELAMEQRLKQYDRDQQIIIANHFDDIQAKQRQDVTQLASYLIGASRQERKEDIGALVSYFSQQRSEDLTQNQQQLNKVVYQLSLQNEQSVQGSAIRRATYELNGPVSPGKDESGSLSELFKQEEK